MSSLSVADFLKALKIATSVQQSIKVKQLPKVRFYSFINQNVFKDFFLKHVLFHKMNFFISLRNSKNVSHTV